MAKHSFVAPAVLALLGSLAACAPDAPAEVAAPAERQADTGPRPPLSTLWDGALVDTDNGDPWSETDGYRRLLKMLHEMPATELAKHTPITLDHALALSDPDRLRGEWVKVRGLIVDLSAERLDHPLDGAVDIWRGWVANTDGSEPVAFDTFVKPEGLELERDLVDVEGILYRTARYENRKGGVTEVPYILAQSVVRVDQAGLPRHGIANAWAMVLIVMALGFIGLRVITMARKQRPSYRNELRSNSEAIRRAAAISHSRPPRGPGPTPPTTTTPSGSP